MCTNNFATRLLRTFFLSCDAHTRARHGNPLGCCEGEGTRKGTTGGREGAGEATSFSTPLRNASNEPQNLSLVTYRG